MFLCLAWTLIGCNVPQAQDQNAWVQILAQYYYLPLVSLYLSFLISKMGI